MADEKISGVPGHGTGREKNGAGRIDFGGKSQQASGGVNFFPGSAQFNPDPRDIGNAAPSSGFDRSEAGKAPTGASNTQKNAGIKGPKIGKVG